MPFVVHGDGEIVEPETDSGQRRSIYQKVRRSQPLTLLQSFDQPVMETNCTRRAVSTVALQALNLLNGEALTRAAAAFARRLEIEAPDGPAGRAVLLALNRPASDALRPALDGFLAAQSDRRARFLAGATSQPTAGQCRDARRLALADLCQMLLSSNEFAYVD